MMSEGNTCTSLCPAAPTAPAWTTPSSLLEDGTLYAARFDLASAIPTRAISRAGGASVPRSSGIAIEKAGWFGLGQAATG